MHNNEKKAVRVTLKGQKILVTGGSRGIGAAICASLAQKGAHVALHYANSESAAKLVLESLEGEGHFVVQADLSIAGAGVKLFQQAVEKMGSITTVVNNAGIMDATTVADKYEQWSSIWSKVIQTNLLAVGDICREAILHYQAHGGGKIINITSRAAHRGDDPDLMHYAASKAAVVALTKSIARGFGKDNIIAACISPGWVNTDMAKGFVAQYGMDAATNGIPLGDIAPPSEIAELVAFLCSPTARHITGATFDINGASYVR